ncbi:hypothetical protein IDAT_05750 [Pseudidiomarina atlantica]|uniref:Uncharacterized protein n=1 Tax=Pseudidiomarina atlantica TaxID=1517416 RepID=A0A094L3E8_9GAMM|nr:hypothetical protein [Pseudidiomarina atlantica]KFZ29178.1 hypothetical protein IDAT_05750 [Pseudidiomarina atlantica]
MIALKALPLSVKLTAACVALLALIDFSQRVWVSSEANPPAVPQFNASDYATQAPSMNAALQQWIEQQRSAAAQAAQEQSVSQPQAELLPGGVNLGETRVRVRATYTSSATGAQLALLEAQQINNRSLELTEVDEGFEIDNYKVSKITADSVVFVNAEGEQVTVPVFDY